MTKNFDVIQNIFDRRERADQLFDNDVRNIYFIDKKSNLHYYEKKDNTMLYVHKKTNAELETLWQEHKARKEEQKKIDAVLRARNQRGEPYTSEYDKQQREEVAKMDELRADGRLKDLYSNEKEAKKSFFQQMRSAEKLSELSNQRFGKIGDLANARII